MSRPKTPPCVAYTRRLTSGEVVRVTHVPRDTYAPWTAEILRLNTAGQNDCQIARTLGIPTDAVRRTRVRHGCPAAVGRGRPRGR